MVTSSVASATAVAGTKALRPASTKYSDPAPAASPALATVTTVSIESSNPSNIPILIPRTVTGR